MTATCVNCGAILPPPEPGTYHLRCHYCQLDQAVDAPRPVAPAPIAPTSVAPRAPPRPLSPSVVGSPAKGSLSGVLALVMFALVVTGIGPLIAFVGKPGGALSGPGGVLRRSAPFATLAKVDPATDIDRSHDALAKLFPDVASRPLINLDHTVAIDHPWYGEAQLSWKNKAHAHLATVQLRPPSGTYKFTNQREIEACVEKTFGRPTRRSEPDHLRGDWDTTWQPASGGEIRVYQHMVAIEVADNVFVKNMPRAIWIKTIAALDACGRR